MKSSAVFSGRSEEDHQSKSHSVESSNNPPKNRTKAKPKVVHSSFPLSLFLHIPCIRLANSTSLPPRIVTLWRLRKRFNAITVWPADKNQFAGKHTARLVYGHRND